MIRDLTIGDRTYAQYVPPDMEEIRAYFEAIARDVMASSSDVWTAGPRVGKLCLHPGGRSAGGTFYYPGSYERDVLYCFKALPQLFTDEDIEDHLAVWFANQQPDGLFFDGVHPDNTGAPALGRAATSYDCVFDLVYHCYLHFLRTETTAMYDLYLSQITTGIASVPVVGHLVYVDPALLWPTAAPFAEFGFQDSVLSRGQVLMCSVLRYRAFRQMAAMAVAAGDTDTYSAELPLIRTAIEATFVDADSGWLRNATVQCVQHSVPGSLYAVVVGAVSEERAQIIAQTAYDSLPGHVLDLAGKGILYKGQVRHMPADEYWDATQETFPFAVLPGYYQDGGYWATFSGDLIQVLRMISPAASRKVAEDLYLAIRDQPPAERPTEALGKGNGWTGAPVYCASVAMVLWNGFEDKDS